MLKKKKKVSSGNHRGKAELKPPKMEKNPYFLQHDGLYILDTKRLMILKW